MEDIGAMKVIITRDGQETHLSLDLLQMLMLDEMVSDGACCIESDFSLSDVEFPVENGLAHATNEIRDGTPVILLTPTRLATNLVVAAFLTGWDEVRL